MHISLPGRLAVLAVLLAASLVPGTGATGQFGGGFGTGQDVELVPSFDKDGDGRLNPAERRAARDYAESLGLNRGRGGRGGVVVVAPGPLVSPDAVRPYPTTPFYDPDTLRTLFLRFDDAEWERDLMAFRRSDVDVPAALTIDGRTYPDVGVQFHGNSSFQGVPMGLKHSMRIALDVVHDKQDHNSYNTLLLLNAHEDPTFLRTVLALQIARDYIPAPQANLVRVVINGESWGIYASQQQFNKDLIRDQFGTTEGARWKVSGTRNNWGSGLSYLGEDINTYRGVYEIKTKDDPAVWSALVRLTRVLHETPADRLEATVAPLLDIDGTLKFLAVENVLVNSDGYWSKASDYSLYMDPSGRFHILPYDVNSSFLANVGRGESITLDPLQAMYDPSKPLAAKLLAVPALRARYLGYVRDIATKWLDWKTLGPIVTRYQAMIAADVRTDTHKLYSDEAFANGPAALRYFADQRRAFLLGLPAPR